MHSGMCLLGAVDLQAFKALCQMYPNKMCCTAGIKAGWRCPGSSSAPGAYIRVLPRAHTPGFSGVLAAPARGMQVQYFQSLRGEASGPDLGPQPCAHDARAVRVLCMHGADIPSSGPDQMLSATNAADGLPTSAL